MREGHPIEKAVSLGEMEHHLDLARIMAVRMDHDVPTEHGSKSVEPRVPRGVTLQVVLRAPKMVIRDRIPAHDGRGCVVGPQVDERPHRHLEIHIRLQHGCRARAAAKLQRNTLSARDDPAFPAA